MRSNDQDELYVERLERNGAAEAAGVLENDVLQAINGMDATGRTVRDVTSLIAGPEGSQVSLVVLRGQMQKRMVFTVMRTIQVGLNSGASTPTRAGSNASVTDISPPLQQPPEAGVGIMLQVFAKLGPCNIYKP